MYLGNGILHNDIIISLMLYLSTGHTRMVKLKLGCANYKITDSGAEHQAHCFSPCSPYRSNQWLAWIDCTWLY